MCRPRLAEAFRPGQQPRSRPFPACTRGSSTGSRSPSLGFLRRRNLKLCLGLALLAGYQFLGGPLPSLLRATTMLAAGGIAMALDRDSELINILSIAGIVLLAIDPFQARQPLIPTVLPRPGRHRSGSDPAASAGGGIPRSWWMPCARPSVPRSPRCPS
ncbi:MAG: ComEC/Rec2 family competence protein [Ignavibacteriales bacterium]|nr:ComEC/Rec2 family competence protein [Ignavibacteriales bacterium]